jgi:hypothetical protein
MTEEEREEVILSWMSQVFPYNGERGWYQGLEGNHYKQPVNEWYKEVEIHLQKDDELKDQRLVAYNKMKQGIGIDFQEFFTLFPGTAWPVHTC